MQSASDGGPPADRFSSLRQRLDARRGAAAASGAGLRQQQQQQGQSEQQLSDVDDDAEDPGSTSGEWTSQQHACCSTCQPCMLQVRCLLRQHICRTHSATEDSHQGDHTHAIYCFQNVVPNFMQQSQQGSSSSSCWQQGKRPVTCQPQHTTANNSSRSSRMSSSGGMLMLGCWS